MTTLRRIALLAVPIVAATSGFVLVTSSGATTTHATTAAPPTTFTRTIAGTDLHSLDERAAPQFVPNSGGGVTATFESNAVPSSPKVTFEAGVDLPKGAKVTAISFTVTPGNRTGCFGESLSFGSYVPQDAITTTNVSLTTPSHLGACTRGTFTKTGNPIATVVDGRRYVIDWKASIVVGYPGDGSSGGIFHGATVKYTCTSPCVP